MPEDTIEHRYDLSCKQSLKTTMPLHPWYVARQRGVFFVMRYGCNSCSWVVQDKDDLSDKTVLESQDWQTQALSVVRWAIKIDRDAISLCMPFFRRAGRRIPQRLNALVRHRSTNTRGKQFQHSNQGGNDRGLKIDDSSFIDDWFMKTLWDIAWNFREGLCTVFDELISPCARGFIDERIYGVFDVMMRWSMRVSKLLSIETLRRYTESWALSSVKTQYQNSSASFTSTSDNF